MIGLLINLAIGVLCGWIAGEIMNSRGTWLRNMILGIVGSFVGGFLAGLLGISASTFSIGGILISVGGACLCIWFVQKYM